VKVYQVLPAASWGERKRAQRWNQSELKVTLDGKPPHAIADVLRLQY
jgi:hypothetical protein